MGGKYINVFQVFVVSHHAFLDSGGIIGWHRPKYLSMEMARVVKMVPAIAT